METGSKQFQAVRGSVITNNTDALLQPAARSLVQGYLVWNHHYAINKMPWRHHFGALLGTWFPIVWIICHINKYALKIFYTHRIHVIGPYYFIIIALLNTLYELNWIEFISFLRSAKLQLKQNINGIQRIQDKVNNKYWYSVLMANINIGIRLWTVHLG